MDDIEVLHSKRSQSVLYHASYVYTQHRFPLEKRAFRCKDRDCKGKAQSDRF